MKEMTNDQKNQWLTEKVLRECWHEWTREGSVLDPHIPCPKCKRRHDEIFIDHNFEPENPNFYSSNEDEQAINFFRLWRAIQGKEWWEDFMRKQITMGKFTLYRTGIIIHPMVIINCSALADAIGEYFEWEEVK